MIVDEVACGYIASLEQVAKCGEAQNIPYKGLMQEVKVLNWLKTLFPHGPPFFTTYPRLQDNRTSTTYMMFCTRAVHNVRHTYEFEETPHDQKVLAYVMDKHPIVRILMTGARFVTVPDPGHRMLLPGEWIPRDTDNTENKDEASFLLQIEGSILTEARLHPSQAKRVTQMMLRDNAIFATIDLAVLYV